MIQCGHCLKKELHSNSFFSWNFHDLMKMSIRSQSYKFFWHLSIEYRIWIQLFWNVYAGSSGKRKVLSCPSAKDTHKTNEVIDLFWGNKKGWLDWSLTSEIKCGKGCLESTWPGPPYLICLVSFANNLFFHGKKTLSPSVRASFYYILTCHLNELALCKILPWILFLFIMIFQKHCTFSKTSCPVKKLKEPECTGNSGQAFSAIFLYSYLSPCKPANQFHHQCKTYGRLAFVQICFYLVSDDAWMPNSLVPR